MVGRGEREAIGAIAARTPREEPGRPIETGVAQTERAEDQRVEEPVVGRPAGALEDQAEHHVPGIAVAVPGSRGELDGPIADQRQDLGRGPRRACPIEEVGGVRVVRHAGGVRQQMVHRHRAPRVRTRIQVGADRGADVEALPLVQQQHHRGRERLGDGRDPEARVGRVRDLPFRVRVTVALREDRNPAPGDEDRAREETGVRLRAQVGIGARGDVDRRWRVGSRGTAHDRERSERTQPDRPHASSPSSRAAGAASLSVISVRSPRRRCQRARARRW